MRRHFLSGIAVLAITLLLTGCGSGAGLSSTGQSSPVQATSVPADQSTAAPGQTSSRKTKEREIINVLVRATAEVTGLTTKDIRTQVESGKSLAQIAQEHNKTGDDILKAARARLEKGTGQAAKDHTSKRLMEFDELAPTLVDDTTLGEKLKHASPTDPSSQ